MSKPVITGFMFGIGLTIIVGQLNQIFGIEVGSGNFFDKLWALVKALPDADLRTTAIGLVALAILLVSRKLLGHKIPMALFVVVVAIVLSNALGWADRGVPVVGDMSTSIPAITIPTVSVSDWIDLLPGAVGIVLVAFATSYGATQMFAREHGYEIDVNQELVALGAANASAGLLGGFAVNGSMVRSMASVGAGAKSQMAVLVCGAITVVTILALAPIFDRLPEAVLAAVVVAAGWRLLNVTELRRIFRTSKGDFAAAIVALVSVCVANLLAGLLVAILVTFVLLIYRASRPDMPRLGRARDGSAYVSIETNPNAVEPKHIRVIRLDAPLFFANADAFQHRIQDVVEGSDPTPQTIVADFESVNFVDTDGADAIASIVEELEALDIQLAVARLNEQGRDALRRANVYDRVGASNFFASVQAAVVEFETN